MFHRTPSWAISAWANPWPNPNPPPTNDRSGRGKSRPPGEELVLDAGVAGGHRVLDEEDGLGALDVEDRHAANRRSRIGLRRRIGHVVGADHKGDIGRREIAVDLLQFEDPHQRGRWPRPIARSYDPACAGVRSIGYFTAPSRTRRSRASCSACFIRSRSGLAHSPWAISRPFKGARCREPMPAAAQPE